MNIIQSVIRFKVVDVLVGNTSQYQNKRVPDGVRMFLLLLLLSITRKSLLSSVCI